MSTPNPSFGVVPLPGVVVTAPRRTVPQAPVGIVEESFSYDAYLMDNPAIPRLYLRLERDGVEEDLIIDPESLEWVTSSESSDMLKFVVPDPDYFLIDHELLREPFKTRVKFRFGYNDNMSEMGELVFFRQRPEFPEGGAVKTTIVCYDYSVFFTLEGSGKRLQGATKVGIKDLVKGIVADVNDEYGLDLDVSFDGVDFEDDFYGVTVPNATAMEHLSSIRAVAKVKGGGDETLAEVYVRGRTLHFHPPRRRLQPIAAFAYFAEHPGSRLLSFTPDVDLEHQAKLNQSAVGVDPDSGQPILSNADGRQGERRATTGLVGFNGVTGHLTRNAKRAGDTPSRAQENRKVLKHTVSQEEVSNLMGIVEQYPGANFQEFLDANGIDPENYELTPGETVLDIPIPEESGSVETPESEAQATAEYLDSESRATTCQATVLGNPRIVAGYPADFFNVGIVWSGRWYLREVTHSYDGGGYLCQLTGTREPTAMNKSAVAGTNTNTTLAPAADPAKQKAAVEKAVRIDGFRGEVTPDVTMPGGQ